MTKRLIAPLALTLLLGCEGLRHDENAPDPSVASYGYGLVPGRPTSVAPAGGTTPTPNFVWTVNDAESAEFQLWIDGPNGRNLTNNALYPAVGAGCDQGALPRTCTLPSPITLQPGSGRWWVRGRHPVDGFGPWSPGLSFNVGCGTTVALTPINTIADPTPSYVWTAVAGVNAYRLYVRDSLLNPVIDLSVSPAAAGCEAGPGGPDCIFTPATPVAPGPVRWWVQTCGQQWSAEQNFVFDPGPCPGGCDDNNICTDDVCNAGICVFTPNTGPCNDTNTCTQGDICDGQGFCTATDVNNCRPILISPTGADIGYDVTYSWNETNPPSDTYRLWVDDCDQMQKIDEIYQASQVCAGGVCSVSTFPGTNTPLLGLSNGRIRWWVQTPPHLASQIGSPLQQGPWSTVGVGTNGVTTAVVTISPDGLIGTNQPTFTWNPQPGQNHTYRLHVRDSAAVDYIFDTTEAGAGCPAGSGTCTANPGFTFPAGLSRFWVKANYQCIISAPWSVERRFTVP